jgi:GT2 family glycosyltransferase
MLRREVFDEVGGLSNRLPNNFNDVDFNQKIRHAGYRILWTPYSAMYHFESLSRNSQVDDFELEEITLRWFRQMRNDHYDAPIPAHLEGVRKSAERRRSHFDLRTPLDGVLSIL